jgi:hypothetical protein
MFGNVLAWLVTSRFGRYAAAVFAAIVALLTWRAGIRRQAKQEVAGEAAIRAQQIQERADAAARDAQRSGAAQRLRDGRF